MCRNQNRKVESDQSATEHLKHVATSAYSGFSEDRSEANMPACDAMMEAFKVAFSNYCVQVMADGETLFERRNDD